MQKPIFMHSIPDSCIPIPGHERYFYDPNTGQMYKRRKDGIYKTVGYKTTSGYMKVSLNTNDTEYIHRLAILAITGKKPGAWVDHINMNRLDNRACNLRQVSAFENHQNKIFQSNSKTKIKGVWFSKVCNKWTSQITFKKKKYHLGYFDEITDAKAAYAKAAKELHKYNPSANEAKSV